MSPLQDMSGSIYHSVGTFWVKLPTAQWGLETESDVIQSVVFYILPSLTLGVPLLSRSFTLLSNAAPRPDLSDSSWCPMLRPLLWIRVSLHSHLLLCWRTQILGAFCKAESLFSPSRTPLILHLLSASSTSEVADLPGLPTQLSLPRSLLSLSPRSRATMPQTHSGVHSLASVVCTGGP